MVINMKTGIQSIEAYIASFPADIQNLLDQMRKTIATAAPEAKETINYGMPTYKYKGRNLVHFAAAKKHIGFYPTPSAIRHFADSLGGYKSSKGAVQFPLDKPLPLDLVAEMTRFRVEEEET